MNIRMDGWNNDEKIMKILTSFWYSTVINQQLIEVFRNFIKCSIHNVASGLRRDIFLDEFDGVLIRKYCKFIFWGQHSVAVKSKVTIHTVSIFAHQIWFQNVFSKLRERYWFFRMARIFASLKCFSHLRVYQIRIS